MRRACTSLLFVLGLAGCTSGDAHGPTEGAAVFAPAVARELDEAAARAQVYGPGGELLESDVVAGGVTLPKGLTPDPTASAPLRHVFVTSVPVRALIQYFGPRVLTGNVERRGDRIVYRNATPRGAGPGAVRLDVSITPVVGGRTTVEIAERRTVPTTTPRTPEEASRLYRESQQNAL